MPEALPDLGQLSEADRESLVLDQWTRLQAARATIAAQGAEVAAARAVAEELRAQLGAALASIAQLRAQVQALEARLGKPPKTPRNSSLPPSRAEKPNKRRRRRKKRKGRPGKGRKLHPQPDRTVTLRTEQCAHCGTRLAGQEQKPQAVYDRIEIPPAGWGRGSPFGESIAQLATYLCYVHAISYQRLCALFRDVFGLQISEGALANLFRRVQGRLGDTLEEIRARMGASRVVKSDESGPRVQGRKAGE